MDRLAQDYADDTLMLTSGLAEAQGMVAAWSLCMALLGPMDATLQWFVLPGQGINVKKSLCFAVLHKL